MSKARALAGLLSTTGDVNVGNLDNAPANLTSATTVPGSPTAGDQWFDTDNGILYAYMTDGTQAQWLDISSANGQAATAAAGGGGTMELISSVNVTSSVTSVSFTGISGYNTYKMIINTTNSTYCGYILNVIDNSVAINTSHYKYRQLLDGGSGTGQGNQVPQAINAATTDNVFGEALFNMTSTSFMWFSQMAGAKAVFDRFHITDKVIGMSANYSPTSFNGIKLTTSTGTIDSGTFLLYGIKDS